MANFTGFNVTLRVTSLKAAAQMNVSSLFDAAGGATGIALLFDALLHTDARTLTELPTGVKFWVCEGTGVRIALRAVGVRASMELTFASLAAHTKLNQVSTEYHVRGIGITDTFAASLMKINPSGDLDDSTFRAIQTALTVDMPKFLETPNLPTGMYVEPVVEVQRTPRLDARAVNYAMSMIARRMPLRDALSKVPDQVDPALVMFQYAQVIGAADPTSTTQLTAAQGSRAANWLKTGALGA